MSRISKVIKYNLESEVNPLLDGGYSSAKIAEIIKKNHSEEKELQNISHMSIERYKPLRSKQELVVMAEQGVNVSEFLSRQLLMESADIMEKIQKWEDKVNKLYDKAEKDGTIRDMSGVAKIALENLLSQIKVRESTIQYGIQRMSQNQDNNEAKYQTLNITMVGLADELCQKCRKKALEKIRSI